MLTQMSQDLRLASPAEQKVKLQKSFSSLPNSAKQGMSSKECGSHHQNFFIYADAGLSYTELFVYHYRSCGRLNVTQKFLFLHWRWSLIPHTWNKTIFASCFDQKGYRSNQSCLFSLQDLRGLPPSLHSAQSCQNADLVLCPLLYCFLPPQALSDILTTAETREELCLPHSLQASHLYYIQETRAGGYFK